MKNYIIIERGSRGEVEDVRYEKSELELVEFCNSIYEEGVNRLKEGIDEEELNKFEEYMEEFSGVSEIEKGRMEVWFNEGESWEVVEY